MTYTKTDAHTFYPTRRSYRQTLLLGWLMCLALLLCSVIAFTVSLHLWGMYTHTFKPYLKWQDALVSLLWFLSFLGVGGAILVSRFLHAASHGFHKGTLTFVPGKHITLRDTSYGNLGSIFWMLNSAFWCFIAALVGLVPIILIEWTVRIAPLFLSIVATGLAILLSLAGVAASVVSAVFIVIGVVGSFSFSKKLGATHSYPIDNKLTLRVDGTLLTAIYPDMPETMFDLHSLESLEQRFLLSLLYEQWQSGGHSWILEWDEYSLLAKLMQAEESQQSEKALTSAL